MAFNWIQNKIIECKRVSKGKTARFCTRLNKRNNEKYITDLILYKKEPDNSSGPTDSTFLNWLSPISTSAMIQSQLLKKSY